MVFRIDSPSKPRAGSRGSYTDEGQPLTDPGEGVGARGGSQVAAAFPGQANHP